MVILVYSYVRRIHTNTIYVYKLIINKNIPTNNDLIKIHLL